MNSLSIVDELRPREFVIPEMLIADMPSARVKDPQLLHLGIWKSQGTRDFIPCRGRPRVGPFGCKGLDKASPLQNIA